MFKEVQNHTYLPITDFDFAKLCALLSDEKYALAVAQIKILAATIAMQSLPFDTHNYTRNIIVNHQHQWLGLVNWDKGAQTRIHGHPAHTFMYVIQGQLQVQEFDNNPLVKRDTITLLDNEYQYSNGVAGEMNNYVHQICAQEKSLSLHFYSGDPTQGEIFDV